MDKNSILLVIDVQNGFVNERSAHVVGPIAAFLSAWLATGRQVVLTRFNNPPGSAWERLIHWTRLRTSPEIDLDPKIQKAIAGHQNARVIDKESYTSLTSDFRSLLKEHATQEVFVCGIATDGCVLKTSVDLFETGITPYVLSDLCASHAGDEVHRAGLLLLGRFIGRDQVITSDAIK
jgi:nicotinamidase-related amidase